VAVSIFHLSTCHPLESKWSESAASMYCSVMSRQWAHVILDHNSQKPLTDVPVEEFSHDIYHQRLLRDNLIHERSKIICRIFFEFQELQWCRPTI
jgi:hypothetical protein